MGSRVVCDECGARYSLSDEAAGRRLHCRECGASVEPVARPVKRKRRSGEVDLTLRIFGIGAMLLTALNLTIAIPALLFMLVAFKLIGIVLAGVYVCLCAMAITAATGKGLAISRSNTLTGAGSIVGGILLSGVVTLCNPLFVGICLQLNFGPPQPVAQVTPAGHSSPAGVQPNSSSAPAPAHTAVPAGPAPVRPAKPLPANAMSITMSFTSFNGRGDAFRAAEYATRGVRGIERVLSVNRADGKIVMLLAEGRLETGDVTAALGNAGFQMGDVLRIGPVESDETPSVSAAPMAVAAPEPVAAVPASPPALLAPPQQPQVDPNAIHAIELKFKRYQGIGPPEVMAKRNLAQIPWASGVLLFDEPQRRLVLQLKSPQAMPPPPVLNFRELEGAGFELEQNVRVGVWNAASRSLQPPQMQVQAPNILGGSSLPDAPEEFDMRMQFNERSPETLKKIRVAVPKVKGVVRIVQLDGNNGVAVVRIKRRDCEPSEVTKAMQSAGIQSIQSSFQPAGK